ncbi:MAG: SAM-dependent methyltransferase [Sphingobacteriales bacterium]|nr:MAG: SAM-dependent methyltransferase [Sphingobacteriales bacterium]
MPQGSVYLIPLPISEGVMHTLSPQIATEVAGISHFIVENVRTARRFLKLLLPSIVIDNLQFSEIDKHKGADLKTFRAWLKAGHKIGVMSEAGCPGIADPGADIIAIAQEQNARISPLTGPSSIILALMASGLNGQSFAFNGYLPVKEPARGQRIKYLENLSKKENQTQIVIETPYRNNHLLDDLLKNCQPKTRLCIALDLSGPVESVRTKTIEVWKQGKPALAKQPAVFLFLA